MKYVLAFTLTMAALVMVFGIQKLIPVPSAFGRLVSSGIGENMPFGVQTAYAKSCIAELESDHGHVQFAVADAAVKLDELDAQIQSLKLERDHSTARIRTLLAQKHGEASEAQLERELSRHDRLEWKIAKAEEARAPLQDTLALLEGAESDISKEVWMINDRLTMLEMDHAFNDARELASDLQGDSSTRTNSGASHCNDVLKKLETRERIREELQERFGADANELGIEPKVDPWTRAREIVRRNC